MLAFSLLALTEFVLALEEMPNCGTLLVVSGPMECLMHSLHICLFWLWNCDPKVLDE